MLRGDRYAIFTAAREAERAAGWLLSRAGLGEPSEPVEGEV